MGLRWEFLVRLAKGFALELTLGSVPLLQQVALKSAWPFAAELAQEFVLQS